jgi:hypothetical protein
MKVKRNLSTPETRAWWAEVDRKADRYKKMKQHDLEKSFTHTNPEPTTDPPLQEKRNCDRSPLGICQRRKARLGYVADCICKELMEVLLAERESCAKACDALAQVEWEGYRTVTGSESVTPACQRTNAAFHDAKRMAFEAAAAKIRDEDR